MQKFILLVILFLAAFLRFYNFSALMPFIGDQGWFYLSARDILLTGNIPLVGIASSHPWLHQGAYWTYILGILFRVFQFHPLAPGYFIAGMGTVTVFLIYVIGSKMFSVRISLITACLYATSPLIIIHDRFPYHTSLISFFTLLFIYSIYRWKKGKVIYFPSAIFLLAVLYNFEIATTPFFIVLLALVGYGIWKKEEYVKKLIKIKIILLSFFSWFIPMVPMLLYDSSHGFSQTVKVVLWVGYRFARLFGFPSLQNDMVSGTNSAFLPFTLTEMQRLSFLPNIFIAIVLFALSVGYITYMLFISFKKRQKENSAVLIIYTAFLIPFVGYIIIHTPSEAYFPMFFPTIIFITGLTIDFILTKNRVLGLAFLLLIVIGNSVILVQNNFLMGKDGYGQTFSTRLNTAKTIINKAQKKEYNIVGKGPGSEFASFTMNYQYLLWWLGHEPSQTPQKIKFIIKD